ncbi:nucleotidyltransferase domain-containing protein [Paenibacillus sp. CAU 1782]
MFAHHQQAIETVTFKLKEREEVLGVIAGGSVAHGFANESSDIDLMIVVSNDKYKELVNKGDLHYYERDSTPYEGGYVDGKYTCESLIREVAERGSEPARFAYKDGIVTYSEIDGLQELVRKAALYPVHEKGEKLEKFYAQLEAWKWMFDEGLKRNEIYLMDHAAAHVVLFAGRLILAHNEALYPFHKWFMRVLDGVEGKPDGLIPLMEQTLRHKTKENIDALFDSVASYREWPKPEKGWPVRFMLDSELMWRTGHVPVADM